MLLWTDGEGEWFAEDLLPSALDQYMLEGRLERREGLAFFAQVVDALGNVAYSDNQGRYYHPFEETESIVGAIDLRELTALPLSGFDPCASGRTWDGSSG